MQEQDIDYQSILNEIEQAIQSYYDRGEVAQYIPALSEVDPHRFAMSINLLDGRVFNVGCSEQKFSIQSISKVFSFAQALTLYGLQVYERLGREPSGDPFNSLVQLEYENGIPRNPFINAGAIVVSDILVSHYGDEEAAYHAVRDMIRSAACDQSIHFDQTVYVSEKAHGHRNQALCALMKSFGNIENEIEPVLNAYFKHCSIEMSTRQLSRAMLFLANRGVDPISEIEYLEVQRAKRINALMLTCGHYDASGDFAFHIGLPGKSGVGGGIVATVPGVMSIAVYSPQLNTWGNSLVGTKALELFTNRTGLSIF